MKKSGLLVEGAGICCPIGCSVKAASAAFRAGLDSFREIGFTGYERQPLLGSVIDGIEESGLERLKIMFDSVVEESLAHCAGFQAGKTALLLLTAEPERPGLEQQWPYEIFEACAGKAGFSETSRICAWGKAAVGPALQYGREILEKGEVERVLLAGVDTYLTEMVARYYGECNRLIYGAYSNGFIPGEGAGAVLLSLARRDEPGLRVAGLGHALETAHRLQYESPNRADGMAAAIRAAMGECGYDLSETDFHISDCSGELFYFREILNALPRCFKKTISGAYKHLVPAANIGETGAAAAPITLALLADLMGRESGPGRRALAHFSGDNGQRAALIVEYHA